MKLSDYYPVGEWVELDRLVKDGVSEPFRAKVIEVDEEQGREASDGGWSGSRARGEGMIRPGEHVVLIGGDYDALGARAAGFQVRDTLAILLPGGRGLRAFLCRRPLEGTVAENVLKHGVGGLWIDGCRVGTSEALASRTHGHRPRAMNPGGGCRAAAPGDFEQHPSGRWPTNLVLVHGPGCRCLGERKVRGVTGGLKGINCNRVYGAASDHAFFNYASSDGTETVPNWDCQPDCPVRIMDEQSGLSMSKSGGTTTKALGIINDDAWKARELPRTGHDDAGGASRFYPQFSDLASALDWLVKLVNGPS